ncbi:MAG TPA: outer membrane lipoprotein-sorting protein [Spirochaetia bacterium]|nr:outer membrane lipoprotein-sorting protein [Spirochaetia bacterium]
MKRNTAHTILTGFLFLGLAAQLSALSAEDIVREMEANQVHKTAESTGSMTISDRFGTRAKTYKAFMEGQDKTLLEFTNPEEAGQKILRIGDDIYLYFPEAEEIIHLQGAALKDSVMGSDFSYEDLTGGKGLLDDYRVELEGSEAVDGFDCYRIRLDARTRDVLYPIQRIWIDKELYTYRRVVLYSLQGKAVKEMNVSDFKKVSGKNVPVLLEMKDLMKKDSKTVFKTATLRIDIPLDTSLFSLEELSW